MIELPEALVLAGQLANTVQGKKISNAIAGASPHKFAWFYGDPEEYGEKLTGKTMGAARAFGGRVEIPCEDLILLFGDGVNLRFYAAGEEAPGKHQLLVAFEDGSALIATVAMYGGIWCCRPEDLADDFYYKVGKESLPPLSDAFDESFFWSLETEDAKSLSAKAFLATKQRIPGLGNGVLQDILLDAGIHPKRKISTLSPEERQKLYRSVKALLTEMTALGGRDTEKDLFGNPGRYRTKLSQNNKLLICPDCGGPVRKEPYLGGSIYYCQNCQPK